MDTFGLGLILIFTDNATSGMNRAAATFDRLSGSADAMSSRLAQNLAVVGGIMNQMGTVMVKSGAGIIKTLGGVASEVIRVGTQINSSRITLSALYGSPADGEKAIKWVQNYARKSVFEFEGLLDAMKMMKAVGIDLFDVNTGNDIMIETSSKQHKQTLLDYAADLAALQPQMRNVYGTGVTAAMGAIREYIAEGNAISLKRGASLDILGILGEDKGKTIADRTRQVADLLEKVNAIGLVANLRGTPAQRISNLNDLFFMFKSMVSDAGVFERYSNIVGRIADYFDKISDSELTAFAQNMAKILVDLSKPLDKVVDLIIKGVDWLRKTSEENPKLLETIAKITGIAGVALIVFGALYKLMGGSMMLQSSLLMMSRGALWSGGAGSFTTLLGVVGAIVAGISLLKESDLEIVKESLKDFYTNVLLPLGTWAINDALPKFMDALRAVLAGFGSIIRDLSPALKDLFNNVLVPLAVQFGQDLIKTLEWIAEHGDQVAEAITAIGIAFLVWKGLTFLTSVGNAIMGIAGLFQSGGLAGVIGRFAPGLGRAMGGVMGTTGMSGLGALLTLTSAARGLYGMARGGLDWARGASSGDRDMEFRGQVEVGTVTASTILGGAVGAMLGNPILGAAIGSAIGSKLIDNGGIEVIIDDLQPVKEEGLEKGGPKAARNLWISFLDWYNGIVEDVGKLWKGPSYELPLSKSGWDELKNMDFLPVIFDPESPERRAIAKFMSWWEDINDFFGSFGGAAYPMASTNRIKIAIDGFNKRVRDFWVGVGISAAFRYLKIRTSISNFFNSVNQFFVDLGTKVSTIYSNVVTAVTNFFNGVSNFFNNLLAPLRGFGLVPAVGVGGVPGAATGGETQKTGLVMMHPNEIIVNSPTIRDLKKAIAATSSGPSRSDERMTFQPGSIVVKVEKASSEADIAKMGDKIFRYIERKRRVSGVIRRNPVIA